MKMCRMLEILDHVEMNYEKLSFSNLTYSEIIEIFSRSLETIIVIITFVFVLIYTLFSEKSLNLLFGVVAIYIAIVALVITTTDTREKQLREVEFQHNLNRIKRDYSNEKLFREEYLIIASLLILKQKNPEIGLIQLFELNKNIFTVEALMGLLYDMPHCSNLCHP